MITPWSIAHERMRQQCQVRTIEQRPPPPSRKTGRPVGTKPQHRREQIRRLLAAGVKKRHMAVRVGISRTAIQRHLRAIRRERSKT